jgi:hypothetical protein
MNARPNSARGSPIAAQVVQFPSTLTISTPFAAINWIHRISDQT